MVEYLHKLLGQIYATSQWASQLATWVCRYPMFSYYKHAKSLYKIKKCLIFKLQMNELGGINVG
jgi:hypothetical protein